MNALVLGLRQPTLADRLSPLLAGLRSRLERRSRQLVGFLDARMDGLIVGWSLLLLAIGTFKVATALVPPSGLVGYLAIAFPYFLIILAPIAGYRLAKAAFPRGHAGGQPAFRFARLGKWHRLDWAEARTNRAFGPSGLLASLLLGLLLDVPMRTLEYLGSVPAVGPEAPMWARIYFTAMTGQLVLLNFFGMVALVMALRNVPLFPRMLVFVWLFDLALQLGVAAQLSSAPDLPQIVAGPLATLLENNIRKVLISMLVWLPYLLLSERVNVTYRQRASRSPAGQHA
ncbi:MAG: DUF2569 domain-containing protein [Proteobacteria bacterium]|nr:DUF2569 domain-containing protein [Pseudomonadota bacterium]